MAVIVVACGVSLSWTATMGERERVAEREREGHKFVLGVDDPCSCFFRATAAAAAAVTATRAALVSCPLSSKRRQLLPCLGHVHVFIYCCVGPQVPCRMQPSCPPPPPAFYSFLEMGGLPADESPAPSPMCAAGTNPGSSAGRRQSLDASMEAGDEEIDWDHTRMLSLGFFPSISTDQVRSARLCCFDWFMRVRNCS